MKIAEDGINLSSPTGKLASLTNTYDPANPITGQSDHFSGQPAINTSYGYSSLNQLTSATSRLNNLTNSYKSAGNLVTNGPEVNQSYNGAGELVSQAWRTRTECYSYDQNGNRTKELGTQNETLSYSGADQLTTLGTGSSTYNYTYKGNNIRYSQTYNGTTTYYVYNTQSFVPQLLGDGTNDYIYGPSGEPMEQISQSSGVPSYLYTDQLGSVVMEANQSGNVTAIQTYSPYGTVSSTTGTWTTPFGFAGGYTDPTGLIYLISRYYDPATGQFVSVDPALSATHQPYEYVSDDPVNTTDPTGNLVLKGKTSSHSPDLSVWSFQQNYAYAALGSWSISASGTPCNNQFTVTVLAATSTIFVGPAPTSIFEEYCGQALCGVYQVTANPGPYAIYLLDAFGKNTAKFGEPTLEFKASYQ